MTSEKKKSKKRSKRTKDSDYIGVKYALPRDTSPIGICSARRPRDRGLRY